ncbi:MAG: tRNA-intron lyase [Promethearchaeota archaeon Loki_b31]|nr:MAG: tRNA-intron lyase [Candidatus Lokiarchaeota archaeon Loki_b31]
MNEKTNEKAEKVQFEGIIEDDKVIISDKECIEEFYNNSYIGTLIKKDDAEDILVLEPIEVLLLCERNRILLYLENDKKNALYDFEGLLEYFSRFDDRLWQKYIIYMDLRKRGYIVRAGYGEGIDFRVYKRGADFEKDSAKFLIYPVFEGYPIDLKELDKMSRVAMSSRKDLIVATVDRLSKPIYYSVNKFEIINKIETLDD